MLLFDDDGDELPLSPDGPEAALTSRLGSDGLRAIDAALARSAQHRWLKVARVVIDALDAGGFPVSDESHVRLHVRRLVGLVDIGVLEAQGNLRRPRWSEVRLPEKSETEGSSTAPRYDESLRDLRAAAWAHIEAERFDQAEVAVRQMIDRTDPDDPLRLWELLGLLASVLNSLKRADEATDTLRRALAEARRAGPSRREVEVARYMLANQFLIYGDPSEALAEVEPIPTGSGHVQCLLHAVAAEALWKLGRQDEARRAAQNAIDASPTDKRRSDLTEQLADILNRNP